MPTFRELGFPNIVGYGWFGFMVPKGAPVAEIDTLSTEVNDVFKKPSMREHLLSLGRYTIFVAGQPSVMAGSAGGITRGLVRAIHVMSLTAQVRSNFFESHRQCKKCCLFHHCQWSRLIA